MREGWKRVKLGEIITLRRGLTYKKDDEVGFSEKIVLRSNNVNLLTHLFDYDELKYLRSDFDIPADKYIKQGELLMCMSNGSKAHLGKVALYDGEDDIYAFGGFMSAISHNDLIASKFLYYALITSRFKDYINTLSAGANINNLKTKDIDAYSIELPSLEEQHRIVELLDAEFAKIDAIKANAEKQLQWAKDLFQSALKDLLTSKEGWVHEKLNKISNYYNGLTYKPADVSQSGYLVLRSSNIQENRLSLEDQVRVNLDINERLKVHKGDIIMCSRNGSKALIGKVAIIPEEYKDFTFGAFMMIIKSKFNSFLYYYFLSDNFKKQIWKGEATMINQITRYMLDDVIVDFPDSIEEQQIIVQKLDTLSEKVKQLQSNYEKTIALCNDLKQSLLKDIFG